MTYIAVDEDIYEIKNIGENSYGIFVNGKYIGTTKTTGTKPKEPDKKHYLRFNTGINYR